MCRVWTCSAHGAAAGGKGDDDQCSRSAPRHRRHGPQAGYGLPQVLARVHHLNGAGAVQHTQLSAVGCVPAGHCIRLIRPQQEGRAELALQVGRVAILHKAQSSFTQTLCMLRAGTHALPPIYRFLVMVAGCRSIRKP